MSTFSAFGLKTCEPFWALRGFGVPTLKGVGLAVNVFAFSQEASPAKVGSTPISNA